MPHIHVELANAPGLFSVRHFLIEERMDEPWKMRLKVVAGDGGLGLSGFLGRAATVVLETPSLRTWRGVCTSMELGRTAEDNTGLATYTLTIASRLWRLSVGRTCRLFQHASIPAIVSQILGEWGIAHELRLAAEYPPLELRTQYEESDLRFVSRLLEEAGISAWFRDEVGGDNVLVLGDAPAQDDALEGGLFPFVDDATTAHASRDAFCTELTVAEGTRPGASMSRDYDPRRPLFPSYSTAQGGLEHERELEVFELRSEDWLAEQPGVFGASGPGGTPVADDLAVARHQSAFGAAREQLRLEALQAGRRMYRLRTSLPSPRPGTTLRVLNHPREELALRPLLSVGLEIEGEVAKPEEFRFTCSAVPTSAPHRPSPRTPKPRIHGVLNAVVVGPGGDEAIAAIGGSPREKRALSASAGDVAKRLEDNQIHVDELGRVRVQFPWDRYGSYDSHSSTWMRVSQAWAGGAYGSFTIPRVGHEVLVSFINGDPDAPVVTGRVHNAVQPAPFKLPENRTVSTWKSASSPGGGGSNELRFDDAAGREHVYLQAQKDMDVLVKNDYKQAVGESSSRYVEGDDGHAVGGSRADYTNGTALSVTGVHRVENVGGSRASTIGVSDSTVVGARWSVSVARGLGKAAGRGLEETTKGFSAVLRNAAHRVLGRVPADPTAGAGDGSLVGLGRELFSRFQDALGLQRGFETDGGPPPTTIEAVDRQIRLTTGEATILLDGPNITFLAKGRIAFHSGDNFVIASEREVAVGAREAVAIVSAREDVVLQAQQNVQLNPFSAGAGLSSASPSGAVVRAAEPIPAAEEQPWTEEHQALVRASVEELFARLPPVPDLDFGLTRINQGQLEAALRDITENVALGRSPFDGVTLPGRELGGADGVPISEARAAVVSSVKSLAEHKDALLDALRGAVEIASHPVKEAEG